MHLYGAQFVGPFPEAWRKETTYDLVDPEGRVVGEGTDSTRSRQETVRGKTTYTDKKSGEEMSVTQAKRSIGATD